MSNEEKLDYIKFFMETLKDGVYKFKQETGEYYSPCSFDVAIYPISGTNSSRLCLNNVEVCKIENSKVEIFCRYIYSFFSNSNLITKSCETDEYTCFRLSTILKTWLELIDRYENALYNVSESVK